jgi:DNA repair exonuclease SbcCD ATPase subunit
MFNAPFTIYIDDADMSFMSVCSDGNPRKAQRLSGGQKALLILSLRMALIEMMPANTGSVTFDEPGAAFDADNAESMFEVFRKARTIIDSTGAQLLVSSHDPRMEAVADAVVTL